MNSEGVVPLSREEQQINRRAHYAPAALMGADINDPLADFRLPGEADSEAIARKAAYDRAMRNGQIRILRK